MPMTDSLSIRIPYDSPQHKRILAALMARKKPAKDKVEERVSDFERHDDLFDCYLHDTVDTKERKQRFQSGEPDYYTIYVPQSYAVALSAHTYWTSVFFGRTPVFQFTGRHGEPQMKVQAVEAIMDYQRTVGAWGAPLYQWLLDPPKYGYGVIWDFWDESWVQTSIIEEKVPEFFGVALPGAEAKKVRRTQRTMGYQGNKLMNIHPAHFWPDWRVPMSNIQDGEFVCRRIDLSGNELARGEEMGAYQNAEVVRRMARGGDHTDSTYTGGAWSSLPYEEREALIHTTAVDNIEGFEIVIDLVPKLWKLGKSNYPEKWLFKVIKDKVIIEARPYNRYHNAFPCSVIQMDFNAYNQFSISMMDRLIPLNDAMTFLLNQHFYNVRSGLGVNFVYDPSMVESKDLAKRGVNKLIRLKPGAWGRGIQNFIQELSVPNLTQSNLANMEQLGDLISRAFGVNDNIMGQVNQGGRKSATEIRTAGTFGISRLKTIAEYWSESGIQPLAARCLSNTQQLYDQEQQYKIAGGLAQEAGFISVTPEILAGKFDFVPVDGTMPIDRYAQANLFREILMSAGKMPMIGQRYDLAKMFGWMMQLSGLKNIKQFEVQVLPDGAMMQQIQAGNMAPAGQVANVRNLDRVPEPGQISGVGATG